MYCGQCGIELEEGARFCSGCGAPVGSGGSDSASDGTMPDAQAVPVSGSGDAAAASGPVASAEPAGQAGQGGNGLPGKLTPLTVGVLVVVLVAVAVLVAFFITKPADQGAPAPSQEQSTAGQPAEGQPTASQPAEETYHHAAGVIVADFPIDWAPPAVQWNTRNHTSGVLIHEGTFSDKLNPIVARFEAMIAGEIATGAETSWEHASADDDPLAWTIKSGNVEMTFRVGNAAHEVWKAAHGVQYAADLSTSDQAQLLHLAAGDRISVADVVGLTEDEAKALGEREITAYMEEKVLPRIKLGDQAATASAASGSEASGASQPAFDQAKAEAEARSAAEAAGKQVFTGTLKITTLAERAREVDPRLKDFDNNYMAIAVLDFDAPQPISATSTGNRGAVQTRKGQTSLHLNGTEKWASYDGMRVTVAASSSDLAFPSDVGGALYSAGGEAELIAPLSEETAKAATPSPAADGDYVLPESSARRYARAELEALDIHTLFLARNEVFARHGCGFKNQELRERFASKPWYRESIPAGSYNIDILSDVERDNVNLMRSIEQERNSPYLTA